MKKWLGVIACFGFAILNFVLGLINGYVFNYVGAMFCFVCGAWCLYCVLDIQRMDREMEQWRSGR